MYEVWNFSSFGTMIRLKAYEHVFAKQEALCSFSLSKYIFPFFFLFFASFFSSSVYIITKKVLFNSKGHETGGCFTFVTVLRHCLESSDNRKINHYSFNVNEF